MCSMEPLAGGHVGRVELLPKSFVWRRLHSLLGLWVVIFLIEHLITNSQAALLFGDSGMGFVRAVNFLKNLPYLPVVEVVLLGVPILFHAALGVRYLFTSKINSFPTKKKDKPSLFFERNHAYSWQRITSWILLVGILLHVGFMRFYTYPKAVHMGDKTAYLVKVVEDPGLSTVAARLNATIYQQDKITEMQLLFQSNTDGNAVERQNQHFREEYLHALTKLRLSKKEVIVASDSFGTATLFVVRNTFQNVFVGFLYSIFVLAAVFHAFNGLWTFMITWGIVLKVGSQRGAVRFCSSLMALLAFLGLIAIWGTYWINLKH